jgi:hypothetical protein
MPKFLAYELFEVTAPSLDEAVEKVKEDSPYKKSFVAAAASLTELPHPVHQMEAQAKFGVKEKQTDGE